MASPPLSFQTFRPYPTASIIPGSLQDPALEDSSSSQEPLPPKKRYADKAQELGIIGETGAALGARGHKKINLEKSDQEACKESLKKPHRFSAEGYNFPLTLDSVIALCVSYFVKTYKGTTLQMIQGVFPTVGKPFWQKQIDAEAEPFITPEMWNFCTQTPQCYEFWVQLPPSDRDLCNEKILKQFQDLVLYFIAVQTLPMVPTALGHVLHDFDSIIKDGVSSEENPPINGVKEVYKTLQRTAKTSLFLQDPIFRATVEIPWGSQTSLKFTFANCSPEPACYRLDDFKLEIGTEDISLHCPSNPWEAFHDHLIHRLVLSQSLPDVRALEMYWAHLVLEGPVFNREQLESILIKETKTKVTKAWEDGKKRLPPGDEAFLAYYLTVIDFLNRHKILPKDFSFPNVKIMSTQTPFAQLILQSSPNTAMLYHVLALMGLLQSHLYCARLGFVNLDSARQSRVDPTDEDHSRVGKAEKEDRLCEVAASPNSQNLSGRSITTSVTDAPRCRKTEISWRASVLLHIPFPGDYEKALNQKVEYSEEFLSCFSQFLEVFFPSLKEVPLQGISSRRFNKIYQALKSNPKFVDAAVRLFVIMNKPIVESDVLDLPEWIELAGEKAFFILESLEKIYQQSRFFPFFSSIKTRVLDSSAGLSIPQQFLNCGEPSILPTAWSRYREAANLTFLMGAAFDSVVLPFALNRVCELCHPIHNVLSPEERAQLLSAYIDRLNRQGGTLSTAYIPKLIELLDPLLDATLEELLTASTREAIAASRIDREKSLLQSLKGPSALLATDPKKWWDQLLEFQQLAEKRGTFELHRAEFDSIFIEGLRHPTASLHTRRGFFKIFDAIARKLFDRGEDLSLVALLRHIPVTKGDRIVRPWLCECLTRAMGLDPNQGAHQWLPFVTALRETGAYQYVDRPFLVRLLSHMTIRFEEIAEVPFLISRVNPNQTEVPHLLDFLLEYYTFAFLCSSFNKVGVGHAFDDMIKHLPLFISKKDDRIIIKISHLVSFLQEEAPKEAELWSKFATLLDLLKQEDLFLEGSIAILESLCTEEFLDSTSITDPPFQCFTKGIPRMGKRLSAPQKARLAIAYEAVVCHAVPHKRENEMIKALPSLNWLTDQLRKDESWQNFARLFFRLHSRPNADLKNPSVAEDAHWIASKILTAPDSPLAAELVAFLLRLPIENLQPSWKPLLAGWIARDPSNSSTKNLYEIILKLADERERRFFERCRDGQVSTEALQEYHKTQAIPVEQPPSPSPSVDPNTQLRTQVEQALSTEPMQAQTMIFILSGLKKLPPGKYDLWERFFGHLSASNIPIDFLISIWNTWIGKNPVNDVLPQHGKYWLMAIQKCLGHYHDMSPTFPHFLIHNALPLLLKLEGEDCKRVTTLCLRLGIALCWRSPIKSCYHELTALLIIIKNNPLNEKMRDLWNLLSMESEFRFAMMLAQEASFAHYYAGHHRFLLNITLVEVENNFTSETNQELVRCFAERPYIPRDQVGQGVLQQWIEKSWPSLKAGLEWNQACSLVRALCMFSVTKETEVEGPDETESAFRKWEELANGTWADTSLSKEQNSSLPEMKNPRISSDEVKPRIPSEAAPAFFDATYALMNKVVQNEKLDREKKLQFFFPIYPRVIQNEFSDGIPLAKFKLRWGAQCFSLLSPSAPRVEEIVKIVLNDLLLFLPLFKDSINDEGQKAAVTFITSLKNILQIGAVHPEILTLTKKIVLQMTDVSWIMSAAAEEKHSWPYLLFCLCKSLRAAFPERSKAVAAVMDVFTDCIHPSRVEKRPCAIDRSQLMSSSLDPFTSYFLTLAEAEDLSAKDWNQFFQGLSDPQVEQMVAWWLGDLHDESSDEKIESSLALARTTLYAKTIDARVFELKTMALCIPPFDLEKNIFHQLLIRTKWILAIDTYTKTLESKYRETLDTQKQIITLGLVTGFIKFTQNDEDFTKYSPFIFEVLKNPENALALSESFKFSETHPLAARLKVLQSLIEMKAKSHQ